jgi:hypothetical protein
LLLTQHISVQMDQVEELSLLLLEFLESEASFTGEAVAAVALTLARMTSPKQPFESDKNESAILSLMEFLQAFHAQGSVH